MIAGGLLAVGAAAYAISKAAPPKVCTPGETKCVGLDLYECIPKTGDAGGRWALMEANSPTCGWLPPGVGPEPQPPPWDANSRLCPYCGLVFASFAILLDHIHIEHPGLPDPVEVDIF